jgi:hypothetical protein
VPAARGSVPLFNTNPANANDADFYLRADGALGIDVIGYSAAGLINSNSWNRIAFVADLAAGSVKYFLNGNQVFNGAAGLDGRHSLYSNVDSGPDLLLLNEGNGAGVFSHEVFLSSFYFIARALSAAEILALGGPRARGISVAATPMTASLIGNGPWLSLNWSGGEGPFQVQKLAGLNLSNWSNLGAPITASTYSVSRDGLSGFFRVVGN